MLRGQTEVFVQGQSSFISTAEGRLAEALANSHYRRRSGRTRRCTSIGR